MHRVIDNTLIARGLILLLAAALACGTVWAQDADVFGTVTDQQGGVVPGVEVTITHKGTGATRTTLSDDTGRYQFQQLTPGAYTITAELAGFKKHVTENVVVQVDSSRRLDLQLEIGEITQVVTVSSGTETRLNTFDATIGINIRGEQIVKLPLESRNVANLLSLQPGAVTSGEVAGARGVECQTLRWTHIHHIGPQKCLPESV